VACIGVAAVVVVSAPHAQDPPVPPPPTLPSDALFDDSRVHDLTLRIHSADWQKLQETYLENTYYPCDLVWADQVVRNVGVRSRGLGSRNARKPGLRLDFDRYAVDQEFLGLERLILENLTQDASGLKERLSMKLYRQLSVSASREAHARLFVNGTYVGLYAMVEVVDKHFLRRVENLDADGYLFEYKWRDAWWFTPRGSVEDYQWVFQPQTHEKEPLPVLYGPIDAFVRVTNTSADFAREVLEYLDPEEFVKYLAAELFLAEEDGLTGYAGMANFYLYKKPQKPEFKFVPWDRDKTFHSVNYPILQGTDNHVLTRRVLEIPGWRARYFESLLDWAAAADAREGEPGPDGTPPRTWLQAEIERQYALVRDAMREDPTKPFANDEFEAAVETLRAFARGRGAFVKAEVAQLSGVSPARRLP
jgi:hypothetical protein